LGIIWHHSLTIFGEKIVGKYAKLPKIFNSEKCMLATGHFLSFADKVQDKTVITRL